MTHPAVTLANAMVALLQAKAESAEPFSQAIAISKSFLREQERKNVTGPSATVRVAGHEGAPHTRGQSLLEIEAGVVFLAPGKDTNQIEAFLNLAYEVELVLTDPDVGQLGSETQKLDLVRWEVPTSFDPEQIRTAHLCRMEMEFFYRIVS